MRVVTARNAARFFGELVEGLASEPVTIVRRGRAVAVMMDVNLHKAYRKAYDAEQDARMIALLEKSYGYLFDGALGDGDRVKALLERIREDASKKAAP